MHIVMFMYIKILHYYLGADKSLARPGSKQARKNVKDTRDINNMETRADIKFVFLQDKAPKEIHAILTEALACFLPSHAKELSSPSFVTLYYNYISHKIFLWLF